VTGWLPPVATIVPVRGWGPEELAPTVNVTVTAGEPPTAVPLPLIQESLLDTPAPHSRGSHPGGEIVTDKAIVN